VKQQHPTAAENDTNRHR